MEGKIFIRLDKEKDPGDWQLTVGCTLPGKWVLHWGVHYVGDTGRFRFLPKLIFDWFKWLCLNLLILGFDSIIYVIFDHKLVSLAKLGFYIRGALLIDFKVSGWKLPEYRLFEQFCYIDSETSDLNIELEWFEGQFPYVYYIFTDFIGWPCPAIAH